MNAKNLLDLRKLTSAYIRLAEAVHEWNDPDLEMLVGELWSLMCGAWLEHDNLGTWVGDWTAQDCATLRSIMGEVGVEAEMGQWLTIVEEAIAYREEGNS